MATEKEKLVAHLDRDAEAFGLPTYTDFLLIAKRAAMILAETTDSRLPTVLALRQRAVEAIKAAHPEYYGGDRA